MLTLRQAGCATVAMTTDTPVAGVVRGVQPAGQGGAPGPGRDPHPGHADHRQARLQAVEVENLDTGARRIIDCDTVVFTGDWIPDHELARAPASTWTPAPGPLVDTALRTSRQGVFAVGNSLHPVDTADIAALDGTFVADRVQAHLCKGTAAARPMGIRIRPRHRSVGVAELLRAVIPPRRESGCCCGRIG